MIRLRGLSKHYASGAAALGGIDLEVGVGEFVTLIGPSGAGKSTLLRCINGLILPTAGEITVDGQSVTGASPDVLRRVRAKVGFVFQHFNLLKRLSVLDNVRVGTLSRIGSWSSMIARFPEAETERARRALRRVGLSGLEHRRADTLSGGQQQRVGIARALVQEPRVLLADEPMSSLDPALSQSLMELLRHINLEDGLTVITSLHVLDLAVGYGGRIIGLRAGRVVHDGPPAAMTDSVARMIFGERES